jgi:hypothetical protein
MKKRKCMADGGMVLAADEKRETVEQMLAKINAKYGIGTAPPAPKPAAPAPQPPTQPPSQQPTGIVDSLRRRNDELKKAANYASGGVVKPMATGGIAGMADNLIGGPRYDSPGGAFVWEDGTRRDGLTAQQGAQLDAEIAMNKARAAAGINQNAVAPAAPVQTMAEQQIAAGINPNAMYRPGGIGDPHASGGTATTSRGMACGGVAGRRKMAEGGIIPVNIAQGLNDAVVRPIVEDFKSGNKAIKSLRDKYPTVDNFAGIHPAVAAAQVANDVMSNQTDFGTFANIAQMVPVYRQLRGLEAATTKGGKVVNGADRLVIDMPATMKKNMFITAAQTLGDPARAFARGGIAGRVKDFQTGAFAPVVGKGSGTSDDIPAVLAGDEVRLSNGEAVVVLPKKTADNEAAVRAIEGIIAATNGKPPVPRDGNGMGCGGVRKRMAQGGVKGKDDELAPITAQDLYRPAYDGIGGALTYLNRGDPLKDAASGIGAFFKQSANQARSGDYGAEHYGVPSNPPAPTQSQVRAVDNSDASKAGMVQYLRDNPGNPAAKTSPPANPIEAARADLASTRNSLAAAQGQLSAERMAQTTGNAGNARFNPASGILGFAAPGYDPTRQNYAPGTGAVTNPRTGRTLMVTPGRYTAADGTETSDWTKTQDYADAQQRHQNNLAELARIQAGRQGRDPVQSLADLSRIPIVQQAAKLESEKGALGNRLANQQANIGDINLRQQQELQALYAAHQTAKTPDQAAAIAEQIRVRTGKDRPSHWKPTVMHGAKTLEGSEADSGYLVNEQTGDVRPLRMGQVGIPGSFEEYAKAVRSHPSNRGKTIDDAELRKSYNAHMGRQ